jgi:pimeloyl-ACP methyl ester carboxylesterase
MNTSNSTYSFDQQTFSNQYKPRAEFCTHSHFSRKGEGEPVVFVHGSFATYRTWNKIVEAVANDRECISIKLPGHASPELNGLGSIDNDLELLKETIASQTSGPITLVGHSYGAVLCLELALEAHVEIRELILIEPVAVWVLDHIKTTETKFVLNQFLNNLMVEYSSDPKRAAKLVINFWNNDSSYDSLPEKAKSQIEPLSRHNMEHWKFCHNAHRLNTDLHKCGIPTNFIIGTNSNPVAHEISRYLTQQLPYAELIEIEGADHSVPMSHPENCVDLILKGSSAR